MKRPALFLVAMLTLGLASCDNKPPAPLPAPPSKPVPVRPRPAPSVTPPGKMMLAAPAPRLVPLPPRRPRRRPRWLHLHHPLVNRPLTNLPVSNAPVTNHHIPREITWWPNPHSPLHLPPGSATGTPSLIP